MTLFPVLFDTNVLYGAYVNDLVLRLAERRLFRPLWSEEILEELQTALLRNHPQTQHSSLKKRVQVMRAAFPDALVEGYQPLVPAMECDDKDRHVLAAAVRSNAALLVTFNLNDFPSASTIPYRTEVVHPDVFLMDQLDLRPAATIGAVRQILEDYQDPPIDVSGYLYRLTKSGLPGFAESLGHHLD